MGIGTIVCGRNVTPSTHSSGAQRVPGQSEGWYKPWTSSPELVFYVRGAPLGEVYPTNQYELDGEWQARIIPHAGKAYDTQNEAMLFLEAIAALGV